MSLPEMSLIFYERLGGVKKFGTGANRTLFVIVHISVADQMGFTSRE
jgi:hypothetical protein